MSYLEELLPEFRKGAKIRCKDWNKGYYIKKSGTYAVDRNGDRYFIHPCDVISDDWELYQEHIDWQYIIDNKCLCWFWDDNVNHKRIYKLAGINKKAAYPFENTTGGMYRHCRPVRKDEVSFYEDKNNE